MRTLAALALLALAVPATAQPDWTAPPPGTFDGSMTVTAVLVVDGVENAESGSRVAAFIDGEIRGVAGPTAVGARSIFFLSVLGDAAEAGEAVEVRAYDAASGQTLGAELRAANGTALVPTFGLNAQVGTVDRPVRIAATVPAEGPGWRSPDPAAYDGYATVTATASLNGVPVTDEAVQVGAFVGGELRGTASGYPTLVGGRRLVFLSVYANTDELGEAVTFRVFDPSTRAAYDVAETVTVGNGGGFGSYGRATAPFGLSASGGATASVTLTRGGWHAFAPPADGFSIGGLLGPLWTQGFPGADAAPTNPRVSNVYLWDEDGSGTGADRGYVVPSADPGETLAMARPGQGFFALVFDDDDPRQSGTQGPYPKTLTVTGTPVATPFPFSLSFTSYGGAAADGWNLLGNPFPTGLAWGAEGWVREAVGGTAYVWDGNDQRFREWSATLGLGDLAGGVIPPFGAFWVRAESDAARLEVREATPAPSRTTGTVPPAGTLQLRVEALGGPLDGRQADAFVALADDALVGLDALDAPVRPSLADEWLELVTRPPGEETPLVIQALPPDVGEVALPVAVLAEGADGGRYRLTWPRVELPAGWTASLSDPQTGATLDLSRDAEHTFEGTGDRLVLSLRAAGTDLGRVERTAPRLSSPHPNPSRGPVRLAFELAEPGPVRLSLFDALGREVLVLTDGPYAPGQHQATLDTSALAPGVYLVRLASGGGSDSRPLSVVR